MMDWNIIKQKLHDFLNNNESIFKQLLKKENKENELNFCLIAYNDNSILKISHIENAFFNIDYIIIPFEINQDKSEDEIVDAIMSLGDEALMYSIRYNFHNNKLSDFTYRKDLDLDYQNESKVKFIKDALFALGLIDKNELLTQESGTFIVLTEMNNYTCGVYAQKSQIDGCVNLYGIVISTKDVAKDSVDDYLNEKIDALIKKNNVIFHYVLRLKDNYFLMEDYPQLNNSIAH